MKKITLLLSFIACVAFTQAQNLLVNPSFETWADGKPTGWTILTATDKAEVAIETVKFNNGLSSLKISNATATFSIVQTVPITAGKTYELSMSYYIESGDGTDARIWSNFNNSTTYFNEEELIATGLYAKLRGPGCEDQGGSAYFPDEKGAWKTYTIEFVAPANAISFDFQFRTYKANVVFWDNFFFGEKTTGFNTPGASKFKASVKGNDLVISNIANGATVEIFSALGSKVQSSVLENGKVTINNLSKGMYVVRVGKNTQKFML